MIYFSMGLGVVEAHPKKREKMPIVPMARNVWLIFIVNPLNA
jgi:hypothetical protein